MAQIKLTNDAIFEAQHRADIRASAARCPNGHAGSWKPTPGYTFSHSTISQDAHVRSAGLVAGVVDVVAAAIAAGVGVPGLTGPLQSHDATFLHDASPLDLRGWAKEYAQSLVDADAPRAPGARWW